MIKKVRWKFILSALLSTFVLLFVILGAINITNFAIIAKDADHITEDIARGNGKFKDQGIGDPNHQSPETPYSIRYFTIAFDPNMVETVVTYNITPETATQEEAIAWAKELINGGTGWTRTYFRFRTYEKANAICVTVIDQSRELTPAYNVLIGSSIGGLVGLGITFLFLFFTSKKFVRPIEDSYRKQKRFVSDASHELKTPITIISMNNEILEMKNGESKETQTINQEVRNLTNIISNLNSLSLLDEDKEEKLNKENINLSNIASEIANSYKDIFNKENKELVLDIQNDICLLANEEQMRKLINILFENAYKYSVSKVIFKINKENERLLIKMENDAVGIVEGPLDTVFERFYRSEQVKSSGIEGSGIGLSVAREIVQLHEGRISAKGEKGFFKIKVEL